MSHSRMQPVCRIAAVVLAAVDCIVGGAVWAEPPAPSGRPAEPQLAA